MSSLLLYVIVLLHTIFIRTTHQCALTSTSDNHLVIIFDEASSPPNEPSQFIYKLLWPSRIGDIIVDCVHIMERNHANYVLKTQTNCHQTPPTTNATHVYPIRVNRIFEIIQHSLDLFPKPGTTKNTLLYRNRTHVDIHHMTNQNQILMHERKTHQRDHILAIQNDIFGGTPCDGPGGPDGPQTRHLLQIAPTMAPDTIVPTAKPGIPPSTIYPTPEITFDPTVNPTTSPTNFPTLHPTIQTNSPTLNPTISPSLHPTIATAVPTSQTTNPTIVTNSPTLNPTISPTLHPTIQTNSPTLNPTISPSLHPAIATAVPTSQTTNPTIVTNLPTLNPTASPTLHPTIPTNSPTLNPTIYPSLHPAIETNSPTSQTVNPTPFPTANTPTFLPTFNPTRNPIQSSTNNPSKSPTDNPSQYPTDNPSQSPTIIQTSNPTEMPIITTVSPTYTPSSNPVISPTLPTEDPTPDPSNRPTYNPIITTLSPRISPTMCPDICDILNVTLVAINETYVECKDEPNCECQQRIKAMSMKHLGPYTASKITFYAKNNVQLCQFHSVKYNQIIICEGIFSKKAQFKIQYDKTNCNGYVDTSCAYDILGTLSKQCEYLQIMEYTDYLDGVCYDDEIPRLIPKPHQTIQNYWKTKALVSDSSSDSKDSRRRLPWDSSSSSSSASSSSSDTKRTNRCWESSLSSSESSSSDTDYDTTFPTKMCLTYKIDYFDPICADLDAVYLPLCTANQGDLSADELDQLIISISPNTLSAKGVDSYNDLLGILVSFNDVNGVIDYFELCLSNVSAMDSTAHFVLLGVNDEVARCDNSNGLPCLDIPFADNPDAMELAHDTIKVCDCKTSVMSLAVRYEGTETAQIIQFRYNRAPTSVLCKFNDIHNGDTLHCNASHHPTSSFGYKTFIDIIQENGDECHGKLWTQCIVNKKANNILNRMDTGCNKLRTVGWMDENHAICDETVMLRNQFLSGNNYNAFTNGNAQTESDNDVIRVFDDFDLSLQAVLLFVGVGIMCGLIWVACLSLFTIYYHCMEDDDAIAPSAPRSKKNLASKDDLGVIQRHTIQRKEEEKGSVEDGEYYMNNEMYYAETHPQTTNEFDQESMKRHRFVEDSDQDKHIVTLPTNNQPKIEEIDPIRLYHMARLFSNSDSI